MSLRRATKPASQGEKILISAPIRTKKKSKDERSTNFDMPIFEPVVVNISTGIEGMTLLSIECMSKSPVLT